MTTEQHMLVATIRQRWIQNPLLLGVALLLMTTLGCQSGREEFRFPASLVAPYDSVNGDVLWAVAPLRNESGVSAVDILNVTDSLAAAIAETRGVSIVPVNRTLGAMRSMQMRQVQSAADARRLALQLGVDAVVVGTVTAWDPYDPPKLGLSLALYSRPGSALLSHADATLDPRKLESAVTELSLPSRPFADAPLSVASEHLDGANHEVQLAVQAYAEGRHEPTSALGWKRYLASMSLFTKFASFRLTGRLLDQERLRLAREQTDQQAMAR
jgi:hypothetical protein